MSPHSAESESHHARAQRMGNWLGIVAMGLMAAAAFWRVLSE